MDILRSGEKSMSNESNAGTRSVAIRSSAARRDGSGTVYEGDQMHGIDSVLWSNLGVGWVVECLCGWECSAEGLLENGGREFDLHLKECGLLN
jgi:hypothetical protein